MKNKDLIYIIGLVLVLGLVLVVGKSNAEMVNRTVKVPKNKPFYVQTEKVVIKKEKERKNHLIFQVGKGYDGLFNTYSDSTYSVKQKDAPVGSLTYCRDTIKGNLSIAGICATVITNKTFLGGLKVNW